MSGAPPGSPADVRVRRDVREAQPPRPARLLEALPASDRVATAAAAALVVLHGVLAWIGRLPAIETRQDDALYVLLAQSLRTGGYGEIFRVDAPVHSMYPPGYSAFLAGWGWPVGDAYDALVLFSVIASMVALALTFDAVRRVLTTRIALLSLAVLAINPALLQYAGSISSEAAYTALAAASLWALSAAAPGRRHLWLAGALAILAALTRSVGAVLILAIGALWLYRRQWKALSWFAAASVVFVGGWFLWTALAPEQIVGKSYVADALFVGAEARGNSLVLVLIQRVLDNALFYVATGVPWILALPTVPGTPIDNMLLAGAAAVGLVVGTVVLLRRWPAAGLYLIAFFGLLFAWTWAQVRFPVPLLPLIVPATLVGLATLVRPLGPRVAAAAAALMATAILVGATLRTTEQVASASACDRSGELPPAACLSPDQASFFEAVRYIDRETPADAVFLTAKPEPLFLYTGRRSVSFMAAVEQPPDEFVPLLRSLGVDYILLGSLQHHEPGRLARSMTEQCAAFEQVAFFPARTYLFRVRGADDIDADRSGCDAMARYREANRDRDFNTGD